ncbi:hypothetical protein KAJ71_01620 [Serratia sp. arafor3]|uniref:Adhesin n=1 Tax=Serratia silvae TaxID=2824122 RepID=A0ABT0K895_9GAMM|nr:hypothetical protein [Serratia silvae]
MGLCQPVAQAEIITIGKSKGIVWEGLPFDQTLSGRMADTVLDMKYGLLSISSSPSRCQLSRDLTEIAGYPAVKIADGVGLVPRASGTVTYYWIYSDDPATLTGTLGPKNADTKGKDSWGYNVSSPSGYSWCLPARNRNEDRYYDFDKNRQARISGTWLLVADGSQKTTEIKVPVMYAGSYSYTAIGDRSASILPSDITLRISTLECSVNTPSAIDFGNVPKNTRAGEELATQSYPLITTCGQSSDYIDANINLQFRPITGLYNAEKTRLALHEGGGYITGEIDNGVTGSGSCTATSGLPFDNSQLKIGSITKAQSSLSITNQVTWRLCSGGSDLPLGNVSAAAEMLVTFN